MFEGMNGSFGTDIPRDCDTVVNEPPRKRGFRDGFPNFGMSLERKADIIAACFMGVLLVLTIVFWDAFSNALFYEFLCPVLTTGGKVILIFLLIVLIAMYIRFRIRRRFGRWY